MARGDATRRRSALVLKHRAEKQGRSVRDVVDDKNGDASKKRKKNGGQVEWTGSMRKFMALKAAMNVPNAKQKRGRNGNEQQEEAQQSGSPPPAAAAPFKVQATATETASSGAVGAQENAAGRSQPGAGEAKGKQAGDKVIQPPSGLFREKTLKARKKAFLKAKEQRKKGGRGTAMEAEELLETKRVISAPRFGEQAGAPLKAHLKRKHWVPEEAAAAAASGRHADLALARKLKSGMDQQEADKLYYDAIAGYRDLKAAKLAAKGIEFNAYQTPTSLASIAHANED